MNTTKAVGWFFIFFSLAAMSMFKTTIQPELIDIVGLSAVFIAGAILAK